jgi:peptidoglycan hydrolase FlgJ
VGVKGKSKKGKSVRFVTHENYKKGRVKISDNFRAYGSIEEAALDYGAVIEKTYADATPYVNNTRKYLDALQDSEGPIFATDPRYQEKNLEVVRDNQLEELFAEPSVTVPEPEIFPIP